MATEQNKNAPTNEENLAQDLSPEEVLQSRVDKDEVVGFIEGMVHAMGSAAAGQMLPMNPLHQKSAYHASEPPSKKYHSKSVAQIMGKLERLQKYPDRANDVLNDSNIHEWVNHHGCKAKEYYEELECAQELTSLFGGYRRFDLAIQAATKARAITILHRRDDNDTLTELNWVLADLNAAADKMDVAVEWLQKTLDLAEPGAGPDHPTYKELLGELQETNERCKLVSV